MADLAQADFQAHRVELVHRDLMAHRVRRVQSVTLV